MPWAAPFYLTCAIIGKPSGRRFSSTKSRVKINSAVAGRPPILVRQVQRFISPGGTGTLLKRPAKAPGLNQSDCRTAVGKPLFGLLQHRVCPVCSPVYKVELRRVPVRDRCCCGHGAGEYCRGHPVLRGTYGQEAVRVDQLDRPADPVRIESPPARRPVRN